MTDLWFLQDIERILDLRKRAVIIDPSCAYRFLLPKLEEKGYKLLKTNPDLSHKWQQTHEELLLRHEAESISKDIAVVFYVTRPQEKLTFLFDYCFTHGCLDLTHPEEWLRKKIFSNTGLQVKLENPLLLTAAKLGMGKDKAWWQKVLQGLSEILNLEDELLPFLDNPKEYIIVKDDDIKELFEEKIFELIGQPYMKKPPETLANEVVKRLLDGLVYDDLPAILLLLYYRWADSETYRPSLIKYIQTYHIDKDANPWQAHPDHCFNELDHTALEQLTSNLNDKDYVSGKIEKIKVRTLSNKVKAFVPTWWKDIISLIEFDNKPLVACKNLNGVVDFYINKFTQVDRSIRNLFTGFLQEEKIIRPLQEYYERLNHELLDRWYMFINEYKTDQQGYLVNLIKETKPKLAVIVGDGLRYEIAQSVANGLQKNYKIEQQVMLADIPSETEHNMSALYVGEGKVLSLQIEREKRLKEMTGKEIAFINLDELHYGTQDDFLILTYKDIDSTGEKLQQGALKLFEEFEQVLVEKITLLLKIGYKEVHLITDHGFVLTGILDEADKIEPRTKGKTEVKERYLRTIARQDNQEYIEFQQPYGEYQYLYTSKSTRPFKSKGTYGYAHGGYTPQEVILPKFVFSNLKRPVSSLEVNIINKAELGVVTGDIFVFKLQAASVSGDLFAAKRTIQILLYAGGKNYESSSILTFVPGKTETQSFSFHKNQQIEAVIIDADSRERIDTVIVKQSTLRDFGGLL